MASSACLLTYNVRPLALATSALDWFGRLPSDIHRQLLCASNSPPQLVVEIYYQSGARYVFITATPVVVRGGMPRVYPVPEDVFIFGKSNTKTCAAVLAAPLDVAASWNDLQSHCLREENRFVELGAFLSQYASLLGGSEVCLRFLELIGCMNAKVSFGLQENPSKETAKKCSRGVPLVISFSDFSFGRPQGPPKTSQDPPRTLRRLPRRHPRRPQDPSETPP